MMNNTTASKYKKASSSIKKQINIDGKQILKSKEVLNQLGINDKGNFIS